MSSIKVICSIQEGALPPETKNQWESTLANLYMKHLSTPVSLKVIWLSIPSGQAFLAGKADSTATLLVPVPNHTPQALRAQFLYGVLDEWCGLTATKRDEVVISAANVELADQFMKENQRRFSPWVRALTVMRVLGKAVMAKIKTGRLETHINP